MCRIVTLQPGQTGKDEERICEEKTVSESPKRKPISLMNA
jgi:hypothetical protein